MTRLALLTAVLLLGPALPTSAKMPGFDMAVEPRGDTVHVEVTIRGEMTIRGHESLIDGFDPPQLNGLLAVLPADQVDEEGRPLLVLGDRTEIPLDRVEPGTYQGSVALEPGYWAVVPFPHTIGALRVEEAYPETVMIEIRDEAAGIWSLAGLIGVMAIAWRLRRVRPV